MVLASGEVAALDRRSGKRLWTLDTGAPLLSSAKTATTTGEAGMQAGACFFYVREGGGWGWGGSVSASGAHSMGGQKHVELPSGAAVAWAGSHQGPLVCRRAKQSA